VEAVNVIACFEAAHPLHTRPARFGDAVEYDIILQYEARPLAFGDRHLECLDVGEVAAGRATPVHFFRAALFLPAVAVPQKTIDRLYAYWVDVYFGTLCGDRDPTVRRTVQIDDVCGEGHLSLWILP